MLPPSHVWERGEWALIFFCSRPLLGHVLRQEAASCRDRRWQASREIEVTSYKRKRLNRRRLQRRRRNENLRYFFFSSIWKKKSCCDRCHSCKKKPRTFSLFFPPTENLFPAKHFETNVVKNITTFGKVAIYWVCISSVRQIMFERIPFESVFRMSLMWLFQFFNTAVLNQSRLVSWSLKDKVACPSRVGLQPWLILTMEIKYLENKFVRASTRILGSSTRCQGK